MNNKIFNLKHINLYTILKSLRHLFWIPILFVFSTWFIFSSIQMIVYTPKFESTAMMAINSKNDVSAYSSLSVTKKMAEVFSKVFQSDVLKNKVCKDLNLDELNEKITTKVIPKTNLLQISIKCNDKYKAYKTLNSIITNYKNVSDYLFNNAVLEIIKYPNIPINPVNSFFNDSFKKTISLIMGFIGIIIIILITVFENTVQNVEAAKDKLNGHLYTEIPFIKMKFNKKNHNSLLINNKRLCKSYIEAFEDLSILVDRKMGKNKYKVLMISSSLENEGKSTISANLALALAERNKKVLIIDCDFRKPTLYKIFEITNNLKQDFGKYLLSNNKETIYKPTKFKKIDIAASEININKSVKLFHMDILKDYINKMRTEYDYIIIDSPPMIISDAEALLKFSDMSILVVRQRFALVNNINDYIDILDNSKEERGYIFNYSKNLNFFN